MTYDLRAMWLDPLKTHVSQPLMNFSIFQTDVKVFLLKLECKNEHLHFLRQNMAKCEQQAVNRYDVSSEPSHYISSNYAEFFENKYVD